MGSKGDKPRKGKHPLPKVPKYEEPNDLPLPGVGGGGGIGAGGGSRFGHSSDHHPGGKRPGKAGQFLLRLLGQRPKDADPH
ncbi:MAG: hypothetical protein ACLQOZ_08040 [Acidimicrobiales bacterium]|jgi:hypothetical protein